MFGSRASRGVRGVSHLGHLSDAISSFLFWSSLYASCMTLGCLSSILFTREAGRVTLLISDVDAMADPRIVNFRPTEGLPDIPPSEDITFGVRDVDTRVPLGSVYSSAMFSAFDYDGSVLPGGHGGVLQSGSTTSIDNFNDAAGAGRPDSKADETIEAGDIYRIERTLDPAAFPIGTFLEQRGFRYFHGDVVLDSPCGAEVSADILGHTTPTSLAPYVTFGDFTGVVIGFAHWPLNSGVFIFFRQTAGPGFAKSLTIGGPSSDGIGTRYSSDVVFDWSADTYDYKVFWDASSTQRVTVFAVSSTGVETKLFEENIADIGTFLPSVRMGDVLAEYPGQRVTVVVGTDGQDLAAQLDVHYVRLFTEGRVLVSSGSQTQDSSVVRTPQNVFHHTGGDKVAYWLTSGSGGTIVEEGTGFAETTTNVVRSPSTTLKVIAMTRTEPVLSSRNWTLLARLSAKDSIHAGTINTAMGIDIEDGTKITRFRFLEDFPDFKAVGVESVNAAAAAHKLESYVTPDDAGADWETNSSWLLMWSDGVSINWAQSSTGAFGTLDESGGPTPVLLSDLEDSTETRISVGFLDKDLYYSGTLGIFEIFLLPEVVRYRAHPAGAAPLAPWVLVGAPGASSGSRHLFSPAAGAYGAHYFQDTQHVPGESGVVVWSKFKINSWTDSLLGINPPRQEFGAVLAVKGDSGFYQIRFTKTEGGKYYLYLSKDSDDYLEVLSQTAYGIGISHEIDPLIDHVYILVVTPFHHVRLYLDYNWTPIISYLWADRGALQRALPTGAEGNVPSDAVVAFGSLDQNAATSVEYAFVEACVGTGFDFSASIKEESLGDGFYGSWVDVLVDIMDND